MHGAFLRVRSRRASGGRQPPVLEGRRSPDRGLTPPARPDRPLLGQTLTDQGAPGFDRKSFYKNDLWSISQTGKAESLRPEKIGLVVKRLVSWILSGAGG